MSDVRAVKTVKHTIDLGDGVEREVTFSLNAMANLEEKFGSIDAAFEKIQNNSIAAIRYLLWCILDNDEQEISEREVGRLIKLENLDELMSTVMDYFEEAMPTVQDLAAKNPETPNQW